MPSIATRMLDAFKDAPKSTAAKLSELTDKRREDAYQTWLRFVSEPPATEAEFDELEDSALCSGLRRNYSTAMLPRSIH